MSLQCPAAYGDPDPSAVDAWQRILEFLNTQARTRAVVTCAVLRGRLQAA
jgi:hypothetical protein